MMTSTTSNVILFEKLLSIESNKVFVRFLQDRFLILSLVFQHLVRLRVGKIQVLLRKNKEETSISIGVVTDAFFLTSRNFSLQPSLLGI